MLPRQNLLTSKVTTPSTEAGTRGGTETLTLGELPGAFRHRRKQLLYGAGQYGARLEDIVNQM